MPRPQNPKSTPVPAWQGSVRKLFPLSNPPPSTSALDHATDVHHTPAPSKKRPNCGDSDSDSSAPSSPSKDTATTSPAKTKKSKGRKGKSSEKWRADMGQKYGYQLDAAESMKGKGRFACAVCGKVLTNTEENVRNHRDKSKAHIRAVELASEAAGMRAAIVVGGEQHRQMTVDTLLLSYFTYREKLPHTLPSKLQPVLSHMHCVKESVNRLPLSRRTIAR